MPIATDKIPQSQLDKFKDAAHDLEADEDEARWDDRLKKVAAHRGAPTGAQLTPDRPDLEEKG